MNPIIGLIIAAFILFFIEIFLPGGILAVIGAVLLLVASVMAYEPWGIWGTVGIIGGGAIGGVALFFLELKILSNSPLRKSFIHDACNNSVTQAEGNESLVGLRGTTLTKLVPTGRVEINKQTFEATSLGGKIEKLVTIEVVRAEHLNLIVKEV